MEPTPTTCGGCKAVEDLYILGSVFICVGCIGAVVSMAANDIWPDLISYTHEFETAVLYG